MTDNQPMKLVLIGGGGHASDVLSAFEAAYGPDHPVIGVLDDGEPDPRRFAGRGVAKIGSISEPGAATHFVLCVGWPWTKQLLAPRLAGLEPASVVHPKAVVHPNVKIGKGTVVMAGAIVSAGAVLGDHVLIHHNAVIGHDCVVGDFVSVMPGACVSGDTTLHDGCLIGCSAAVKEGVTVGENAKVGIGSVVLKHVPPGVTVRGLYPPPRAPG